VGRDAASVGHDLGVLLFVPSLMAGLSVPVALAAGEPHALAPLAVTGGGTAAIGAGLVHRNRHARTSKAWPAVEVVALGWLLTGLASALVFWGVALAGDGRHQADEAFLDPWNAVFEGLSGITSTGLTMVDGTEADLSRTLQWWRSLLQWFGGVGVALFAIGFAHTSSGLRVLYEAEGRSDDLAADVRTTVRRTWLVYLGLTGAAVLALLATEQRPWEALNHGVTAISTGGFTVTSDSLAGYGAATKLVAAALMLVGSISFVAHHVLLVRRDPRRWWRLTPVRAQLVVLLLGLVLVVLVGGLADPDVPVVDRTVQWVSASATAGLSAVEDVGVWSTPVLLLLVVGMAIGAPSGSTGGGIKVDRVAWLAKGALARLRGRRTEVHWDGAPVQSDRRGEAIGHAAAVLGLWLGTLVLGGAALWLVTGAPAREVLFDATSALGNVGLDTGVVGPDLGWDAKAILVALMYLGRLELLVALTFASQEEHGE
jgi:trk system potassium uptake protein